MLFSLRGDDTRHWLVTPVVRPSLSANAVRGARQPAPFDILSCQPKALNSSLPRRFTLISPYPVFAAGHLLSLGQVIARKPTLMVFDAPLTKCFGALDQLSTRETSSGFSKVACLAWRTAMIACRPLMAKTRVSR
jgi:hypothetical protein